MLVLLPGHKTGDVDEMSALTVTACYFRSHVLLELELPLIKATLLAANSHRNGVSRDGTKQMGHGTKLLESSTESARSYAKHRR